MTQIITPGQQMQPRIVTLAELNQRLVPLCQGNRWALSTIRDLWLKGAPVPTGPGEAQKRILLPRQFQAWWNDLRQTLGMDLPGEQAYQGLSNRLPTGAGLSQLRRKQ
jgi:hypothetical protein